MRHSITRRPATTLEQFKQSRKRISHKSTEEEDVYAFANCWELTEWYPPVEDGEEAPIVYKVMGTETVDYDEAVGILFAAFRDDEIMTEDYF